MKLKAGTRLSIVLFLAVLGVRAEEPSAVPSGPAEVVENLLQEQAAAWNEGDLEAFCSAYQEDVTFVSPSGLTQGRQGVLDRYRKRYPDRAAMGHLALTVEETRLATPPGEDGSVVGASVVARWHLSYEDREDASGWTLLVFHRQDDGTWRIVQDASF